MGLSRGGVSTVAHPDLISDFIYEDRQIFMYLNEGESLSFSLKSDCLVDWRNDENGNLLLVFQKGESE